MSRASTIKPFSEIACIGALNRSFFYPSNAEVSEKVEDKNSVRESLKSYFEVDSCHPLKFSVHQIGDAIPFKQKKNITHHLLKPFRFTARLTYFTAVSIFVAPAGLICHSGEAFLYVGKIFTYNVVRNACSKEDLTSKEDWEMVSELASCAFRDFKFAVLGAAPLTMAIMIVLGKGGVAHGVIGAVSMLGLVMLAADPSRVAYFIAKERDREELVQSLNAKNKFGLVSKQGELLSYKGSEKKLKGVTHPLALYQKMAGMMHVCTALKAKEIVQSYNSNFGTGYTLGFESEDDLLPSLSHILSVLQEMSDNLVINNDEQVNKFKIEIACLIGDDEDNLCYTSNIHNLEYLEKVSNKLNSFFKFPPQTVSDHYALSWKNAESLMLALQE